MSGTPALPSKGGQTVVCKAGIKPSQLIGILIAAVILGLIAGALAAGRLRLHVPW